MLQSRQGSKRGFALVTCERLTKPDASVNCHEVRPAVKEVLRASRNPSLPTRILSGPTLPLQRATRKQPTEDLCERCHHYLSDLQRRSCMHFKQFSLHCIVKCNKRSSRAAHRCFHSFNGDCHRYRWVCVPASLYHLQCICNLHLVCNVRFVYVCQSACVFAVCPGCVLNLRL